MNQLSESKKTDRNRFTRMCIGEAFIDLLRQKDYQEIHVSDIVLRAGTSRMTYYNYYHTKQEVLSDYLQEIVKEYIHETTVKKDIGTFHDYAHILHCLHFFDQYSDFILILVRANLYSIIIDAINDYMIKQVFPDYPGSIYELYYYSGALLNIYVCWICSEKKESAEEIAGIIASLLCTDGTQPG